jgi:hypothetical protein
MSSGPTVAKTVWTDADFDAMNWHDAAVHAIALEPAPPHPGRLLVDLDYVVERVPPGVAAATPSVAAATPGVAAATPGFWVCPATLVFGQARELAADINLPGPSFRPSLDAIRRSGPDEDDAFVWTLVGHLFSIGLRATGFTQYLRRAPVPSPRPRLTPDERGGLSFDQRGYAG